MALQATTSVIEDSRILFSRASFLHLHSEISLFFFLSLNGLLDNLSCYLIKEMDFCQRKGALRKERDVQTIKLNFFKKIVYSQVL